MRGAGMVQQDISDVTRRAIWDGMLDAARMLRYAEAMEQKYARQRRWVRIALSMAATAGVANFLGELPNWVSLAFGSIVGVSIAVDSAMDYSGKLAKLMYAKMECAVLLSDWEALWLDVQTYRLGEEAARQRHGQLDQRLARTTAPMAADMSTDARVNEGTSRDAYADIQMRFTT